MIFSAKDESGKSIFHKVVSGQKTVTTRYGVDAERQLKKWNDYEGKLKQFWTYPNYLPVEGKIRAKPVCPSICLQKKRGAKSEGRRLIKSVFRRNVWWAISLEQLGRYARPGQLPTDIEKAKELEAWKEGFSSWSYFVNVASEFAKSKGKKFEDGVRIEFERENL